jgi:protein-S-isoprenylcysteine O-methyltransferase Ste14
MAQWWFLLWVWAGMLAVATETVWGRRAVQTTTQEASRSDDILKLATLFALAGPLSVGPLLTGERSDPEVVLGAVAGFGGVALRAVAMRILGVRYQLSVSDLGQSGGLVESGPYRLVRHPGYLGLILYFTGAALLSAGVLGPLFVLPMLAGVVARIRLEDAVLRGEFGPLMIEYEQQVPWRLVPFVY